MERPVARLVRISCTLRRFNRACNRHWMSWSFGARRFGTGPAEEFRDSSAAKQDDNDGEHDEPMNWAEFSHGIWILVLSADVKSTPPKVAVTFPAIADYSLASGSL